MSSLPAPPSSAGPDKLDRGLLLVASVVVLDVIGAPPAPVLVH